MEIAPGSRIRGFLEMICYGAQIVFLWCPDNIDNLDILDPEPNSFRVAIFLHNVDRIIIDSHQMNYGAIDIKFKDGYSFPTLYFTTFGNIAVSHLASFLIEKEFATPINECEFTIHVLLKHSPTGTPGSMQIPEGFISSSKFLSLLDHWKLLDSLDLHGAHKCSHPLTSIDLCDSFASMKKRILMDGMDNSLRGELWPILLGVYPPNADATTKAEIDAKNLALFRELRSQFESLFAIGQRTVVRISQSIKGDTSWLSENTEMMSFVIEILKAYSQYNRDTGHAEGMNDILVQIVTVVIGEDLNKGRISDGRNMDRETAMAYAFACFVAFIERDQHNLMFSRPYEMQKRSSEEIYAIISKVCPPMASWMQLLEMTNMMFVYRPILLMYQRDIPTQGVLRLWDALLCTEKNSHFLYVFTVAFVLLLFGPCLILELETNGDVLDLMSKVSSSLNVQAIIHMALKLIDNGIMP